MMQKKKKFGRKKNSDLNVNKMEDDLMNQINMNSAILEEGTKIINIITGNVNST